MFFSHLTPHIAVSLQGTTITQLNPAKDSSGMAIANRGFSSGIHYFEIVCPHNTEGVKIGITKHQQPENFEGHLYEFSTTTQRTIGVLLNFNEHSLQFYLNGNQSTNKGLAKGQLTDCEWYPCIRLSQYQNQVHLSKYEDRSIAESFDRVKLSSAPLLQLQPKFIKNQYSIILNRNQIYEIQDQLVSVRNCPPQHQRISVEDARFLVKMGLAEGEGGFINLSQTSELKKIRQFLKFQMLKLQQFQESKVPEVVKDQLLQEITQMLPNNEVAVQEPLSEEQKFYYSIEQCKIAQKIIINLIEQCEDFQEIESAKWRLQTFADHPATHNPFEVVEQGVYLLSNQGVKYGYLNYGNTKYSPLILRSSVEAKGKVIDCRSDRYFALRQEDCLSVYNGEAELFKVIDVDLRQLGPYLKQIKKIEVQSEETPSHIYKILENYITGETQQFILYDQQLLEKLLGMGFEEQQCKEALIQTNNQFESALDILSSHFGEWQCVVCTLLNKESNLQCEACETPKPDEQEQQQPQIREEQQQTINQQVIIEEKEEIDNNIKETIAKGSIDHVQLIHWDGGQFPLLVVSVHNQQSLSVRFLSYSESYLDQFFIEDDGWYCTLTNMWSKEKDYGQLLKSFTSRQIIETFVPLYSKNVKKFEIQKVDHKGIQIQHNINVIEYAIWQNQLYLFLLGNGTLTITQITNTIEIKKTINVAQNQKLLVSKNKLLIYGDQKSYLIDTSLKVTELDEQIHNAQLINNQLFYNNKLIEDNNEILQNNTNEEVQIFQSVFDDEHEQKFIINDEFLNTRVQAIFEGPIEQPKQVQIMNSPLHVSDPQKLQLTIQSYKGAASSYQTFVTQMLFENNKAFSSNYPNASFIFRNQFDEMMLIDNVVVCSEISNVCRGFPIGAGLIFIAKEEHELFDTQEFDNFDQSQYEEWKQNHQSLYPNEPVGYFEFEGDSKQCVCKLEIIRPCRFILLKPTNLRKTPHDYTAHFSTNAIEILYFAAYGKTVPPTQTDHIVGCVEDCQLIEEIKKRFIPLNQKKFSCKYKGSPQTPSNGQIEFDLAYNGVVTIKPIKSEYRLLKLTVIGQKYNNIQINEIDQLIEQVYQKQPSSLTVLNLLMRKESKTILEMINLKKFILGNVLSQDVNEQVTEFFCLIQQHPEFHDKFLNVAQQILYKIEKVILTESGLEYFVGLLTYTAKFKTQQVTDMVMETLFNALQKVKSLQNKDTYLFSTKYDGQQKNVKIEEDEDIIQVPNQNQKPLVCSKDPLSQILIAQVSNKQQIRRFEVNLLGEFDIHKISLRFQQTANVVKFRVQVWADNLILDQVFDEATFVQFTDYVHKVCDAPNYNCLHININKVRARKLLVQLTLGSENYYSKQSVQLQIPQNYLTIIPEFYGTLINAELSPLQINEDFRYKTTLALGETFYYVYQSENSILMDSYNVYKKTDLTDHYIVMSSKSIRRNADYLEQAIYKLQSEKLLKEKCKLPTEHLQQLIQQTQLELLKVAAPRNYENNTNFLTVLAVLLLNLLTVVSGTVSQSIQFIKLIIEIGDIQPLTDLALQFIKKQLKPQIDDQQWNQLIIEQTTQNNLLKRKLLQQLPIPLIESLTQLIQSNDEILFDSLIIQLQRIPSQKVTDIGNPINQNILELVLEYLQKDSKFRLNLLQHILQKCTAQQIKNVLNQQTCTQLLVKGLEHPEKLKNLLDLLCQPRQLESKYTDWAATMLLSEQANEILQAEKDCLAYISKFVIYLVQMFIKENLETLSIDNLLLLFDFLTRSVKKINKLKVRGTQQKLNDFDDFLQRQNIQICYPDTINRLITLLEKSDQFYIWNKVLKVVQMITPQLQNELRVYNRVIQSYIACNNQLFMNEILQLTINLAQQQVQQNQTCSQIVEALLPHLGKSDINQIFVVFSEGVQQVYLNNVNVLLKYIGIYLPNIGGKDGIQLANNVTIQQLELAYSLIQLLCQSESTMVQLGESTDLNPLIEWYCMNSYNGNNFHSQAGILLQKITIKLDQLFDLLPCKQYLLKQFFQQQYYIDNVIIKEYQNQSMSAYTAHTLITQILKSIQSQFDKFMVSDEIALQSDSKIYYYLIEQIIREKQQITVNFLEEEYGNKMKIYNLPGQNIANQDWQLHKKGAKSRLALIQMPTSMYSEYQMIFQLDQEIDIKSIRLGLQSFTTDFTDKQLGTPRSILLEMGKSIDELYPVSELWQVNDEFYSQFQVKLFCYNSKSSNAVKFISFRMRQQYVEQIDCTKPIKKLYLGVSFISVMGYNAQRPNVDFVYTLQEKTAIDLLSKFCKPNYHKTLQHLANDQIVLEQLQSNIDKFMSSLKNYSQQLSPLLMAIAKYNHSVGDWLVDKLMEHPEQSHSKLLSQIILEGDQVHERFQKLHNYLFPKLLALQNTNHQQQDLLLYEKLAQHFIESYCNVLLLQTSTLKQRELQLNINKNDIIHLISLFELLHTKQVRHLLIKLIVNITYLPHPYQQIEDVDQILKFTLDMSLIHPYFLEVLGPLSLGSHYSVDWIIQQLDTIFKHFQVTNLIQFLYTLSTNKLIADNLLKYLLRLYNSLIEEPNSKTILKEMDDKTINTAAKFISYMVQKYHAKFIIEALIRDISRLEQYKDMRFVRQLLVPILNSEDYIFLKLQFEEQGRFIMDPKLVVSHQIETTQQVEEIVFESQLLSKKQRDLIFTHITENIWNKVAYQKNDGDSGMLPHLEDKFFHQSPQLMVVNYRINNQDRLVILYHNAKCEKGKNLDITYTWTGMMKILHFNESGIQCKEIDFTGNFEMDGYDEQGTLSYIHNEVEFLEIEYVAGEPSRINLTQFGINDHDALDNLKVEYYVQGVRQVKQKKVLPNVNLPQENTQLIQYEINEALQYYTVFPIYQVPSQMKLNELKQLISMHKYGLKPESNLLSKQTKLSELETNNQHVVEITLPAKEFIQNLTLKTDSFAYPQQLTIFPIFEELNGVNAMLQVIREGISQWKNVQRANAWMQFLNELQSFCQLPNFFNLFMKNQQCVNLLFDLIAGPPDSTSTKKLEEEEQNAVKFIYTTLVNVFSASNSPEVRIKALEQNLIKQILDRIALVSKETKRVYKETQEEQKQQVVEQKQPKPTKKESKKGVGYASDNTGQNSKWNTIEYVEKKTQKSQQLIGLLGIVESFFDFQHWHPSEQLLQKLKNTLYESALLPLLESAFRSGSLLEISKEFDLYCKYLKIVQSISHHKVLASVFLKIPEQYYPQQTKSLQELLTQLADTSQIFLSCLTKNKKKDEPEDNSKKSLKHEEEQAFEIAKMIIDTHKKMETCISKMENSSSDSTQEEDQQHNYELANQLINEILAKPLAEAYRTLLSDLRFSYIDMKVNGRYKHHYQGNVSSQINTDKIVRLAQEFADMSTSLPIEHTNAIFVRADKERADVMKALVMGAKSTPYAHGAYLFDIYADDSYPNTPPKMNLSTTGNGKVRFNPNLYSCGKVCLSLLGTWRGNASENWDPKISTLLQVLVSTQAIIMSEEVYFNEPGFEQEANTEEGERKNEGYSNIVRYCNIKYAMIDQLRDPPKGFESIIKRHFYLKKQEILEECNKWIELAETKEAVYTGLLNDHNQSWCNEFKKGKKIYQKKLQEAVKELEDELNKLQPPSAADLEGTKVLKIHQKKQPKVKNIKEDMANLDEVDVTYTKMQQKEFEANDESVLDRWSRYIGAMGMDAVKKQANSTVLISGIGALGIEVAKNVVLSGVKMLTIHDQKLCTIHDLSGQFFVEEKDIGKNRAEVSHEKLQQLNSYVRVNYDTNELLSIDVTKYTMLIICITYPNEILFKLQEKCRANKVKLIISSVDGVYARVFNDFGQEFIVEDKTGEQTVEYVIKAVQEKEQGKLQFEVIGKHDFQDNDVVIIDNVEGMIDNNSKSINKTIHKVKVISKSIIEILLQGYSKYQRNGTVKLVKVPTELKFQPYTQEFIDKPIFDFNMSEYDYDKIQNVKHLHNLYNGKPIDNEKFEQSFKHYSVMGEFAPLSAFLGGFVSQEAIKGLTNKFMPVQQLFYIDCCEVLDDTLQQDTNTRSLSRFLGQSLSEKIEKSKVFMVGCGAIGCELLKNFAMLNLGVQGTITITDPDHIEVSNLNRQFLFREKHLRKPKSQTAAAAVIQMNPLLKNHIIARLDKVHDSTEHIYTDQFFEELSIVANALDNVAARRYVDSRCVNAHTPLLESGTLGPKGHVQCIIPFQTESYGSSNDPVEEGDIPYCTLKMFPEETFHCVEFARDKFGKLFSARPKQLIKMMAEDYIPTMEDNKPLREGVKLIKNQPKSFSDCVRWARGKFQKYFFNDIKQLMYTYPEDAKTKEGNLFWTLPKRPPKPILFDPQNELHSQFVATFAYLRAKLFGQPTNPEWRTKEFRALVAKEAASIEFPEWEPSEAKKKQISDKVKEEGQKETEESEAPQTTQQETQSLFEQFKSLLPIKLIADEFEKDNDQNGHIDFIHSFGNLRAANYKLEVMDWLTVKIKAGRIVPALATTTAVVAGLQTIELIKTLKGLKLSQMKNAFVNLAIPFVQLTEPGSVPKKKINEKVTVTLWDRWTEQITKQTTLGQLFDKLHQEYELHPRDLFVKAQPVYMEIMYAKKPEEKKHILDQPLAKLLDIQKYLDLTINFTLNAESNEIIKGIPTVRVVLI